jgi:hypothetical protein
MHGLGWFGSRGRRAAVVPVSAALLLLQRPLRRLSGSGSRSEFHFLLPTRKRQLANGGQCDSSGSGWLQALQSAPRARVASQPQAIVSVVDGLA